MARTAISLLRTTLKIEMPIVDIGTTDPTVTETRIQWLLHNFPDDRQQGYTMADHVFNTLKLKRIGVIRTQTRYARLGVEKFNDEARRMGRQPVLEVKFERGDKDFSSQLRMLRDAKVQGVVIWGEAAGSRPHRQTDARHGHETARLWRQPHCLSGVH